MEKKKKKNYKRMFPKLAYYITVKIVKQLARMHTMFWVWICPSLLTMSCVIILFVWYTALVVMSVAE